MGTPIFLLIALALFPPSHAAFHLFHRVISPSLHQPPFLHRAHILLDTAGIPRIEPPPPPTLQSHFEAFAETAHVSDALYQLALDPHPGANDSLWLLSSVKACHVDSSANEHIVLRLPYPGGTPFAIEYFIDPVPSDGTCPPGQTTLALPRNITITTAIPKQPSLPELRVPPPLTATGDPVVQEPEKTFLQKYWLYILMALGALIIAPGPEEGARGS
ncbi:hypothetical protein F5148DRAFT_55512 [Russula earlei]|uniref:Uncharacterized protein n=1 Tax=Russula earlei TaxID=71964 RepID=A0ACC0UKU1_9AGAM|nr:hypothetical protein F5148DRAFT_55512 [Russula earlei]